MHAEDNGSGAWPSRRMVHTCHYGKLVILGPSGLLHTVQYLPSAVQIAHFLLDAKMLLSNWQLLD